LSNGVGKGSQTVDPYLSFLQCKFVGCLLQNLLGAISLRRTKDMEIAGKSVVALPPKTVVACYIELSAEERGYYDQMELEGRNKMLEFGDREMILRNYSTVLYFILRLRQLCNDVALCPLDMKSWFPTSSLEGMDFSVFVFLFMLYVLMI
jgi:SWI/SNF-related matrix-associated actin-dependent regulator of chromatin subfamily A3